MSLNLMQRCRGYAALPLILAVAVVVTSGAIAATLISGEDQLALRAQQQEAVNRVENAIMGFVMREYRLPCPDTTSNGEENCPSAENPEQRVGAVPYRTLGISGRTTLNLLYAPYIGDELEYNLVDRSDTVEDAEGEAVNDVVRIELPEELPDLGNLTIAADRTDFGDLSDLDPEQLYDLLDLLAAVQAYENFLGDLIINRPARDINGNTVNNSLSGYSGNYIEALRDELDPEITVPNSNLSFDQGSESYDDLLEFVTNLIIYQRSIEAKDDIYDHEVRLQLIAYELSAIVADGDLSDAAKVTEINDLVSEWESLLIAHNSAVNNYNNGFSGFSPAPLNASLAAEAPQLDEVVTSAVTGSSYVALRDDFEVALEESLNQVGSNLNIINGAIQSTDARQVSGPATPSPDDFDPETADPDDFDPDNFDGSNYTSTNAAIVLRTSYETKLTDVENRIDELDDEIDDLDNTINDLQVALAACQADADCSSATESAIQSDINSTTNTRNQRINERQNYILLKARYEALIERLGFLNDDLYCRATDDGDCTTDGIQDAYLDRIEELAEALTTAPPDDLCSTPEECADEDADDPDRTNPSESITFNPLDYPTIINMADFCYKLDSIAALGGTPAIGYVDGSTRAAAFVLVEYGNNQRLDGDNRFPDNNGIFEAPNQAQSLVYDDRVRPMTIERMSIALGCAALLQSYRSFANTAEEINLLYIVAEGNLDGALQDVITAGITLALATIRLAVDTAAVIKDTVGGVAATATCIASLGLAVNACVSAGFQFSAAAAHGFTLIADAVAVAQAAVELATAIEDRIAAEQTLRETVDHYTDVIEAALNADFRGGMTDAMAP